MISHHASVAFLAPFFERALVRISSVLAEQSAVAVIQPNWAEVSFVRITIRQLHGTFSRTPQVVRPVTLNQAQYGSAHFVLHQ